MYLIESIGKIVLLLDIQQLELRKQIPILDLNFLILLPLPELVEQLLFKVDQSI